MTRKARGSPNDIGPLGESLSPPSIVFRYWMKLGQIERKYAGGSPCLAALTGGVARTPVLRCLHRVLCPLPKNWTKPQRSYLETQGALGTSWAEPQTIAAELPVGSRHQWGATARVDRIGGKALASLSSRKVRDTAAAFCFDGSSRAALVRRTTASCLARALLVYSSPMLGCYPAKWRL